MTHDIFIKLVYKLFHFITFTKIKLLSIILNKSKCKFFVDESNSCIAAHRLALSIAQSGRNCKLDV